MTATAGATPGRAVLDAAMTEKQLQQMTTDYLRHRGWRCFHAWIAVRSTPGFPDILAVRGETILALELKSERGTVTLAQHAWLDDLRNAGVRTMVIRPSLWDAFVALEQQL